MNNIFDTHAHYSSRQFDADRAELLTALPAGGVVGVLECATHSGDAAQVLELAHAAPYFHAALGIHPESLIEEDAATVAVYHGDWRAELAAMRPLFADKAVAAVGEIGLDHHWPVPRQEQYDLFEAQLQLAKELDLPVSVHDREAHAEMYELLRKYKPRGALHCYSGSADDAAWLVEQGMYLGFGGAVTYKARSVRPGCWRPSRMTGPYWKPTAPTWPPNRCGAPATTAVTLSMWPRTSARSGIWTPRPCWTRPRQTPGLALACNLFGIFGMAKICWDEHWPPQHDNMPRMYKQIFQE